MPSLHLYKSFYKLCALLYVTLLTIKPYILKPFIDVGSKLLNNYKDKRISIPFCHLCVGVGLLMVISLGLVCG